MLLGRILIPVSRNSQQRDRILSYCVKIEDSKVAESISEHNIHKDTQIHIEKAKQRYSPIWNQVHTLRHNRVIAGIRFRTRYRLMLNHSKIDKLIWCDDLYTFIDESKMNNHIACF